MEREILEPIDVAHADGRLVREAVGWSRRPMHRFDVPRTLSRVCAWNYWCITGRGHALTLLVADVGIAWVALVSLLDLRARSTVECGVVRPFGLPVALPDTPNGDVVLDVSRIHLAMRTRDDAMHVEGAARTIFGTRMAIDLVVDRPASHETVNVLVPFDDESYQLTSKQQALPTRGTVRVGARSYRFDDGDGWTCLDFGRGRWPRGIDWNWGFASGKCGDRVVGFNLGGKWTDGTGVTENGVVVDGRLHKISDDVDFEYDVRAYQKPWRVRTRASDRVDLRLVPENERVVRLPFGVLELHQTMGRYSGTFVDDDGKTIVVNDLFGLAESMHARW